RPAPTLGLRQVCSDPHTSPSSLHCRQHPHRRHPDHLSAHLGRLLLPLCPHAHRAILRHAIHAIPRGRSANPPLTSRSPRNTPGNRPLALQLPSTVHCFLRWPPFATSGMALWPPIYLRQRL